MYTLFIDVETRWPDDLNKHGLMRCLSSAEAGLNCLSYAVNDSKTQVLDYYQCRSRETLPKNFIEYFMHADKIVAHKADFERPVLQKLYGLDRPLSVWSDTMARCAYHGLPLGLDDAAKALSCAQLKDIQGAATMKTLMTGKFTPEDKPVEFNRTYSYCAGDTDVMRMIHKLVPELPPEVQQRWMVDYEINEYGMPIDTRMLANALMIKHQATIENERRMQWLTRAKVMTIGQVDKIQEYAAKRGVAMIDCTADTVERTLALKDLPEDVRVVLELRQEAGLSSLSKYETIRNHVTDGRLYQQHFWYGTTTGRPTGTGPQVLNLPRPENADTFEAWADAIACMPWLVQQFSRPTERLKDSIRGIIKTDDRHMLIGVDLAQIEARATGWVAGADNFIQLFLTTDPYCTYGAKIFGHPMTKKQHPEKRQASKASLLSLGFAGGIGAYQRVGVNARMDFQAVVDAVMPLARMHELAEGHRNYDYYMRDNPIKPLSREQGVACDILKQRYRKDFPRITAYWDELESAFLHGGQARLINVEIRPGGLRVVTLPSGRQLFYHGVRTDIDGGYSYQSRRGRKRIWKGTLIENVAQAINADVSDWYKVRARQIAPIIHHCYDEFTLEVEVDRAEAAMAQLKALTQNSKPEWSAGLPLGFDYWMGRRYGK